MAALLTQPNEQRCACTHETHRLNLPACCPASGNPQPGSTLSISYYPAAKVLEVVALQAYVASYRGGLDDVRSMEGMIQRIAADCAAVLHTQVVVKAKLFLAPSQRMKLRCTHG